MVGFWIGFPVAAYIFEWKQDISMSPKGLGIALMLILWALPIGIVIVYHACKKIRALWNWSHN